MKRTVFMLLSLCGCSHSRAISEVRFRNQPIVWKVDDRIPFAEKPKARKFTRRLMYFEETIVAPIDRALAMPPPTHALDVNALDEVPDSSWFDNRLLVGLTPEEIERGPLGASAANLRPWKIVSTKEAGRSFGLLVEDSRGDRHLLKFDFRGHPELTSAADAIVGRLLWALGYQVPLDEVVELERSDLIVTPDAMERFHGNERPLTEERLNELLATVDHRGDRFRALVSRMLPGDSLGGYALEGIRDGDPNDVVPHEHRRELRGQFMFFAWVDHTDCKEDNRLDMWIPTEGRKDAGHIEHYMVDFDGALGALATTSPSEESGYMYVFDPAYSIASFASLGLWVRPWETIPREDEEQRRGVGRFESIVFDPVLWKPRVPTPTFSLRDRFDDFWAAKRMMMLTHEQIRAAVHAGRFSDPIAERYVYETLLARREKLARYAFARVTPLDRFAVMENRWDFSVCFDDLALTSGFEDSGATTYRFRHYDDRGRSLGETGAVASDRRPTVCTRELAAPRPQQGYNILAIDVMRAGKALEPIEVHLARSPAGNMRIIGLVRRPI